MILANTSNEVGVYIGPFLQVSPKSRIRSMTKKVISGICYAMVSMTKRTSKSDCYFRTESEVNNFEKLKQFQVIPHLKPNIRRFIAKLSKRGLRLFISKIKRKIALSFTKEKIQKRLDFVNRIRFLKRKPPLVVSDNFIVNELFLQKSGHILPDITNVRNLREDSFYLEVMELPRVYRHRPVSKVPTRLLQPFYLWKDKPYVDTGPYRLGKRNYRIYNKYPSSTETAEFPVNQGPVWQFKGAEVEVPQPRFNSNLTDVIQDVNELGVVHESKVRLTSFLDGLRSKFSVPESSPALDEALVYEHNASVFQKNLERLREMERQFGDTVD